MDYKFLLKLIDYKYIISELKKLRKEAYMISVIFLSVLLLTIYVWQYPLNPTQSTLQGVIFTLWAINSWVFLIKICNKHYDLKDKEKEEKMLQDLKAKQDNEIIKKYWKTMKSLNNDELKLLKKFVDFNSSTMNVNPHEYSLLKTLLLKGIDFVIPVAGFPNYELGVGSNALKFLKGYFKDNEI